jgi:hypothetical protein
MSEGVTTGVCEVFKDVKSFLLCQYFQLRNRDSSVGIATSCRLEDGGVGVQILVGQEFSLLHVVQTGCGVHPTSYTMGNEGSFLGCKAAGA